MDTPLPDAVKVAFLSFDSAMRSNLGVARPLDMVVMPRDRSLPLLTRRIEPDDEYFNEMSLSWAHMLHQTTRTIPDPPFMEGYGGDNEGRDRGAACRQPSSLRAPVSAGERPPPGGRQSIVAGTKRSVRVEH